MGSNEFLVSIFFGFPFRIDSVFVFRCDQTNENLSLSKYRGDISMALISELVWVLYIVQVTDFELLQCKLQPLWTPNAVQVRVEFAMMLDPVSKFRI